MRKTALAAGGFALVIALSACGGKEGGQASAPAAGGDASALFGNAQELVQAATAKTSEKKTSKFSMEANAMGQQMTMKGEGRYEGDNTALSMTMNGPTGEMEMRFVDKAMFIKLPKGDAASSAMSGGKPWVKISQGGNDPISKMLGGSFDQMTKQSDPAKTFEQVQKAGTITKSEKTQLDGQEATHYSINVDMAKAAAESSVTGLPKDLADKVKGTMPMELWLNSDQLPMQVTMDMTEVMKSMGVPGGENAGGKTTIKYTDWGAPVNVEAPAADQVGEFKMPEMPKMPQPTR